MASAKIIVCSLEAMRSIVADTPDCHLISLINEQMMPETPGCLDQDHHLKLSMNDIEMPVPGSVTPSHHHAEQLIEFSLNWDQHHPLIIHCWAGISRSTAAAFITLCALNPDISELKIARSLRERSATATPNSLLVSCADQVLQRSGQMINAIEEIGRGQVVSQGSPFILPAYLGKL